MELYTLKLQKRALLLQTGPFTTKWVSRFEKQNIVDNFESLIWSERYYGDGDFELVVPLSMDVIEKIPMGIFLGTSTSNEIMIAETVQIEDRKVNIKGISLLSWLNNRFIRNSKLHKIRDWQIEDKVPEEILWMMVNASINPEFLTSENTDIHENYLSKLVIPELGLHNYPDFTVDPVTVTVSFGPLYDELQKVAMAYGVGMQILLETNLDPTAEFPLGFRTYRGLDKTSSQNENPIVRFSPSLDSLTNIKELQSQSAYKTIAFAFAPSLDETTDLGDPSLGEHNAGIAFPVGMGHVDEYTGFDCRAIQVFADDVSGFPLPISNRQIRSLIKILSTAAKKQLADATIVKAVDGEIVSTDMFQYGRDYSLGDLVEIEGNSGVIKKALVTEYIRVQDMEGERGYPTVTVVEDANKTISPSVDTLGPLPHDENDDLGDAIELTGTYGQIFATNVDCTTDGMTDDGNTDWLVHEFGSSTGDLNWRTIWYKWAIPFDDWVEGESVFQVFLTDYDTHLILFLLTPWADHIPPAGSPPAAPDTYLSLGGDSTAINTQKPYGMLSKAILSTALWTDNPDTYEPWIYIGISTPPVGKVNNVDENHGSRFTLTWFFTTLE